MHLEEEEVDEGISQNWINRLVNILICRGDLANEKLDAPPVSLSELFRYSTRRDRVRVAIGVVLAIVVGIIQPITCIVSGYIANLYLKNENQIGNDELWKEAMYWCAVAGCSGLLIMVLGYLQSYFLMSACAKIVQRIRYEFVRAVLRQDAAWFDQTEAGAISSQLNDNIERIRDGMGDKIGLILRGFSMFIASAVFSFAVNWRTTVVSIGIGPLGAMTMGMMARFSANPMRKAMTCSNEAGSIAEESIMNVKTVAACNGQKSMVEKYRAILDRGLGYSIRLHFLNGFFEGCMFFQLYLFFCAGLLYGVISFFEGTTTEPGSVLVAANTVLMGGYFLSLLGPHMMSVLKARVAAAVIYKTIDRRANIDASSESGLSLENCRGKIEFEDVHFQYPTRDTPILNGCSWEAQSGETIAFVGHSGCGKSTSIGLLTRLYDCVSGTIKIDGVKVEEIRLSELRKEIGIVQQEPCLFNGTIKENIILGRDISEAKMEEAARTANAHDFIQKLQYGYDTVLGVGGVALSGGQKQRIAIARAIVGGPKILLLDEATSALDTESERVVQMALNRASRGRTTIMIAHRLSTLKDVSRIHVIDKGRVVEIGSHFELLEKDGLYASLAKAQEVGIIEKRKRSSVTSISSSAVKPIVPFDTITRSSVRGSITHVGLNELSPIEDAEEQFSKKGKGGSFIKDCDSPLFRLYFTLGGPRWQMYLTLLCSCLRGLELPAFAYIQILPFIALQSLPEAYLHPLWEGIIAFMVVGIFCWFFICTAIGFGGWASESLVNRLRVCLVKSLLHRDAAYFDQPQQSNAACVSTISLHTPTLLACLDYRFMLLCNNLVSLVVCLLLTYISCWPTGIASTCMIGVFVVVLSIISKLATKYMKQKSQEDLTAEFAIEIFEQARTIQLLSVEGYFTERYQKLQEKAAVIELKLAKMQSLTFALTLSYIYFSDLFCYGVGAYMIYYGSVTSAKAFVAALCANFSGWSVIFASPSFNDVMRANSAARCLFSLMGTEEIDIDRGTEPDVDGNISVEKVSFCYPARPDIFVAKSLNLKSPAGQAIALVGASGCGKSTIIQLLERFYSTKIGTIKLDDSNILDISLRHLRKNIALVGQEPVLFRGSIAENIGLGCDDVTIEDVRQAAETANAARFIEAFPQGYETDVGEKGRGLSGGQKQRIAIARALVRNPRVLLLDEATSALDTESEEKVQKALNVASSGRTSITIAHRLSTIRKANRIYLIEAGSVVEYGTHDELIEADGKYAKLVAAQALQKEE